MKSDALLINVGRGSLIDTPALTRALEERRIAGAVLDVLEKSRSRRTHRCGVCRMC